MRYLCVILLVFLTANLFSQTSLGKEVVNNIAGSRTVYFTVSTTGCFNAGVKTYTVTALKNKNRKVSYSDQNKTVTKVITSKNYKLFIDRFAASYQKFSEDIQQTCTLTTEFELSNKKEKLNFTNNICDNDFHPENYLMELIK